MLSTRNKSEAEVERQNGQTMNSSKLAGLQQVRLHSQGPKRQNVSKPKQNDDASVDGLVTLTFAFAFL